MNKIFHKIIDDYVCMLYVNNFLNVNVLAKKKSYANDLNLWHVIVNNLIIILMMNNNYVWWYFNHLLNEIQNVSQIVRKLMLNSIQNAELLHLSPSFLQSSVTSIKI